MISFESTGSLGLEDKTLNKETGIQCTNLLWIPSVDGITFIRPKQVIFRKYPANSRNTRYATESNETKLQRKPK